MGDPLDLSELVSVEVADVYKGAQLSGQLRRTGPRVAFGYLPGYDGRAVATTLPIGEAPTSGPPGAVPPFFAGLLPEGRRLTLLQQALKTSADDELTQLLAVGGDTVGDVRVVPAGREPVSPAPRFDRTSTEEIRFTDLLTASVADIDRVAIPGVQAKVSARMQTLPVRGRGLVSDAILKLEIDEFPLLPQNETVCLAAAGRAGLAVPEHEIVTDAHGRRGLLVRRFDRIRVGDELVAVAQEDGCQVLGIWPADKYRQPIESVVGALASVCAAPKVAALRLWEQVVFSYLIANGDLHAKNLSVRRGARGREPTPVYDVICSFPYGDTLTMALPLLGERNPDRVSRAGLLHAGAQTGVPGPALARSIDRLLQKTADLPARIADVGFPGIAPQKLRRVLERRRDRLA